MAISVVASGGLLWMLLKVGLGMGGLPLPCWEIPPVLSSPDGAIPLFSLQTTDK